ncbi:MAG: phospholipase A [Sedimentisphaerales bacterium]|jgi:outer membrane phospholipase A|nr:phospholipase A [Sedimentisphaerales bacterium]
MDRPYQWTFIILITAAGLCAEPNVSGISDQTASFMQSYLPNLEPYEPMYFLLGADPSRTKFQLSLKYRLFNRDGSLGARWPWVTGLYFGYTQTSFWDLDAPSEPFEDTSYKPELLFRSDGLGLRLPYVVGSNVQLGLKHESNGRDGQASRSTNFAYIRSQWGFYDKKTGLGLLVMPNLWLYLLNDKEHNRDLPDYRGYGSLDLKIGFPKSLVLGTCIRVAQEGLSTQIDLTYPLHRFLAGNLDLYLHVQYVNCLAESLLYYQERTKAFRIGFAVVR